MEADSALAGIRNSLGNANDAKNANNRKIILKKYDYLRHLYNLCTISQCDRHTVIEI